MDDVNNTSSLKRNVQTTRLDTSTYFLALFHPVDVSLMCLYDNRKAPHFGKYSPVPLQIL